MPIQYDAVRPDLQRAGLAGSQGEFEHVSRQAPEWVELHTARFHYAGSAVPESPHRQLQLF